MRKTFFNLTSGFSGLLRDQTSERNVESRQEDIRTAMLASLAEIESTQPQAFSKTLVVIAQAPDVQSLWDARSELLRLISERDGEESARKTLDTLTEMFRGLVPHNQLPTRRRKPR